MTRFAAILSTALLVASPAFAANYSAKPLAAPTAPKIIAKDISWACADGLCHGATAESRPLVLCQDLAKHTGALDSFVVDGRAIAADDLAKCNKSAKGGAPTALAKAN